MAWQRLANMDASRERGSVKTLFRLPQRTIRGSLKNVRSRVWLCHARGLQNRQSKSACVPVVHTLHAD